MLVVDERGVAEDGGWLPSELVVPAGTPLTLRLTSDDVIHGFAVGQSVRIVDGPFQDFVGQVDELNLEKGKVKVLVSFFGRETPVELDFLQVERL